MAALDDLYGRGSTAAFLEAAAVPQFSPPAVEQFSDGRGVRLNVTWGQQASMKIACDAESMIFLALDPEPVRAAQRFDQFYDGLFAKQAQDGGIPGFFRSRGVQSMRISACEGVPEFQTRGEWGNDAGRGGLRWGL